MGFSINFLSGYKTYICVGLAAIVFIGELVGAIPSGTADTLFTLLGFGGILGVRSAIAASAPRQP